MTVSAELPTEPAAQAVDGSAEQWGAAPSPSSGDDRPGRPSTIGSIRLLVGQWPAGRTVHQLYAAGADGATRLLVEFSEYTQDYDLLEYVPPAPLTGIQYIRVVTVSSPSWVSWREIEALAPLRPTPTPTAALTLTPTP